MPPRTRSVKLPPWAAVGLAAAAAIHVLWALSRPVGCFNDDALQLGLARSILHGAFAFPGPGGNPVTDPLPGFALVLALPVAVLSPHWGAFRAVALLMDWAAIYAFWRLAGKLLPETEAWAAALLMAFSLVVANLAGAVLPDLPFAGLAAALLCALPGRDPPKRLVLLGLCAALAALMRPQGALLAGSLALAAGLRGGWRRAAWFSAAAFLAPADWFLRNHLLTGSATGYLHNWTGYGGASGPEHWRRLIGVLFGTAHLGLPKPDSWSTQLAGAALLLAASLGAFKKVREGDVRAFAMAVFGIGILALHATWPWADPRYAAPLIPLVWIFAVEAVRPLPRAWKLGLGGLALLLALNADLFLFLKRARGVPATNAPETMDWIAEHTPKSAAIQTACAPSVHLLADRAALLPPMPVMSRDEWLAISLASRAGYLELCSFSPGGAFTPEMAFLFQGLPSWADSTPYVARVYENKAEGTSVFRFDHPDPGSYLRAWRAYQQACLITMAGGPPAKARAKLREALKLEPRLAVAWAALGSIEGRPAERLRDLEKAAAADPTSPVIRDELQKAQAAAAAEDAL